MADTPLSVVIIACNEEAALPACLASAAFADEVLLVDSGSTDATVRVAEQMGARVLHQEWLGFGAQKRFAVEQAGHDWVLCIDADERISDALRESIQSALKAPAAVAYEMPRCNRFLGRWLRHGEGYPDWSLRLFDRRRAGWSEDPVHEKVVSETPPARLSGDLLHESEEGLADYLHKQNRYTSLQAKALYRRGKRAGVARLLLSPTLRFIKFYVVRRGFLDGVPGLIHIAIGCFNSFMKYAKLRELYTKSGT
ncbi:MAG: glycosyltransferase family 2 protein [Gammaproteobacteria bacterium]|jgi:glycosyltransferase involved in cell wall biosynthesis